MTVIVRLKVRTSGSGILEHFLFPRKNHQQWKHEFSPERESHFQTSVDLVISGRCLRRFGKRRTRRTALSTVSSSDADACTDVELRSKVL